MRTTLKVLAVLLIAATHFSFAQSTEPDGRTYALRQMTLKPGVDAKEFEKYSKEQLNSAFRNVPGVEARVAKADRGSDKGNYLLVFIYDSKATRDHYYPNENAKEYSKAAQEMNLRIEAALLGLFNFADQQVTSAEYTDYVFIE